MVAVGKQYVKKEELISTIEALLKVYQKIRVEFPSDMEGYFLVKAWRKRKQ